MHLRLVAKASLVDKLLDMSRLPAEAISIDVQPTAVDQVVARALNDLGQDVGASSSMPPLTCPASPARDQQPVRRPLRG